MPTDPFASDNKRQTWNGAYTQFGSGPTSQVFKRREKRRSDLSSLLQPSSTNNNANHIAALKTVSAPVSPTPLSSLPYVSEETDSEDDDRTRIQTPLSANGSQPFGAAALALHRNRKSVGMEAFRMPPPSYFSPSPSPRSSPSLAPQTPRTPPSSTLPPGSRFTPIQAARNPLSLASLHHAVQGALASKRYACAHLLALRFADEEDEGYWEDVRSVVGLLTGTLADAAARLGEALTEVEQQRLRDQNPTPGLLKEGDAEAGEDADRSRGSIGSEESITISEPAGKARRRPVSISFAPLPSHVSRFAAHVEAITAALDDARENLDLCVRELREGGPSSARYDPSRGRGTSRPGSTSSISMSVDELPTSPALEAYERLRRELGLALRECERGRERLLDIVYPPDLRDADDEDDSGDDIPALGHDVSDDSDKLDPPDPFDEEQEHAVIAVEGAEPNLNYDDVTSHLLLSATTQHLPPPGIEQVFEADSGTTGIFKRERSKLTREERIQLAKLRRESGRGGLDPGLGLVPGMEPPGAGEMKRGAGIEKWGPGGEVVQELKDVIWKVGERRRKMAGAPPSLMDSVTPSEARGDIDAIGVAL